MSNHREAGLTVYSKMRSSEDAQKIASNAEGDSFASPMASLALDFAFGGVWSREGLERRGRSLVTIGTLIALRQTDELRKHIQMGTRNGLTPLEIREAIIQSIPYVGFPAATTAMTVAVGALKEIGIDPEAIALKEKEQ